MVTASAMARGLQGTDAVSVADARTRAAVEHRLYRLLVRLAAVTQHNRFDQGCPVEVVDMIDWRTRRDQNCDDLMMAEMCRRY